MRDTKEEEALLKLEIKSFLNTIKGSASSDEEILRLLKEEIKAVIKEQEESRIIRDNERSSSVVIIPHPNNSNFRMFAVLDDIPGKNGAYMIADVINKWFSSLDDKILLSNNLLYSEFIRELSIIEEKITRIEIGFRPSFSGIILGNDNAFIANIGNKYIYNYYNYRINPLSKSVYRNFPENNKLEILSTVIKNSEYDSLLLVSNGEYGNIINNEVKIIARNTNRDELAKRLLEVNKGTIL